MVPAADFSEHISIPGEEACTTIAEKFVLNGTLLIGSHDSTNLNIAKYIGEENITLFGHSYDESQKVANQISQKQRAARIGDEFKAVVESVLAGQFGTIHPTIVEMLQDILNGNDP